MLLGSAISPPYPSGGNEKTRAPAHQGLSIIRDVPSPLPSPSPATGIRGFAVQDVLPARVLTQQLGWPLCRACHRTDKYCFPACSERLSALPHPLKQRQAGCLPNWWAAPRSAADEIVIYSLLFVFFPGAHVSRAAATQANVRPGWKHAGASSGTLRGKAGVGSREDTETAGHAQPASEGNPATKRRCIFR